jgi:hypothetical protein
MTWKKINSESYNLKVGCMTQAPDGTIYVGTGELYNAQDYSMFGALDYQTGFMGSGMYKSTDGDNFSLITSTAPTVGDENDEWAFINEIQIDQNGRIYAATNTGLKYSDDDGETWSVATDTAGQELTGLAMDVKVGSGIVVVTVDNKCYVSAGDASKFVDHSTGEDNQLPLPSKIKRTEFAIAPSDNNVVYACLIKDNGNLYGVYRSIDSGQNWDVILPGTNSLNIFYYGGLYYNSLTVFPDTPNKILLGGADLWMGYKTGDSGLFYWEEESTFVTLPFLPTFLPRGKQVMVFRPGHPNEFFVGTNSGIFKGSIQNGVFSYQTANMKYYTTQFYSVGNSGLENYVIGGANENSVVMMNQQSNGYEGDIGFGVQILGGIPSLYSGGDAAVSLINPNIIVIGDAAGKIYRSDDMGENYSVNFTSDGSSDLITLNDGLWTPFALWESFDNEYSRDTINYKAHETIPGGSTITLRSKNSGYPVKYTLPSDVTLNPGDSIKIVDPVSSVLFVASKHKVYMTRNLHNFGVTTEWFEIANTNAGFEGVSNALAYSADANHLFVGTTEGRVFRISNLALAYNKELADINEPTCIVAVSELEIINPETGNPVDQAVTSIAVDPQNQNKVLVTFGNYGNSNYVFYTDNALDQHPDFVSKQGDLPQMPVYSSVIEMSNSNYVIIGTDMGVYMTEDITSDNPQWMPAQNNMGSVPVMDLKQQIVAQEPVTYESSGEIFEYPGATNYGIIYGATYGRGLLRCNNFRKPVGIGEYYSDKLNNKKLNIYPNPAKDILNVKLDVDKKGYLTVTVFDMTGKVVLSENKNLSSGQNSFNINVSGLPKGNYLLTVNNKTSIKAQQFIKY